MPTIVPEPGKGPEVARKLLDAAGDHPERVKTVTTGAGLAFDVDDDLAKAVTGKAAPKKAPVKKAAPAPDTGDNDNEA